MKSLIYPLCIASVCALTSCTTETTSEDNLPNEQNSETTVDDETSSNSNNEVVEASITYGIDISKWQGDEMSLLSKENDSLSFVICRSSEGITYTDPTFVQNWKLCKEKGFIRGAYHFYLSDDAPEEQAEHFANVIKDMEDSDLPPIIDFEEGSIAKGSNKETVIEDLWKFIFALEQKTGRTPIIYTDENIGNSYLTASRFTNYPLWVANYTNAEAPTMPGAWKGTDWMLWQKSDNYQVENIKNDFDCFNGSISDLNAFISNTILK
ncbi:MAG: GH25 family lysozyme [Crocinitomicaceae bacterium]